MKAVRHSLDDEGLTHLDRADSDVLGPTRERELLRELADCKRELAEALARAPGVEVPDGADDPQALGRFLADLYAHDGATGARLGAVHRRYCELRSKLALANMRLVAHVAKWFRDRGVAYADLIQEGFCGLLEAIDRFDLGREIKLASYATWWIRRAMQRAVAGGAYPVRLSPCHLRWLAQNQGELGRVEPAAAGSEMIRRIHAATRPTVSLDAVLGPDRRSSLLQVMSDPVGDRTGEVDTDETLETLDKILEVLRPRDREVLALRFGLGGGPELSLSEVGKVLGVTKERARQIQGRALEKLRAVTAEDKLSRVHGP